MYLITFMKTKKLAPYSWDKISYPAVPPKLTKNSPTFITILTYGWTL